MLHITSSCNCHLVGCTILINPSIRFRDDTYGGYRLRAIDKHRKGIHFSLGNFSAPLRTSRSESWQVFGQISLCLHVSIYTGWTYALVCRYAKHVRSLTLKRRSSGQDEWEEGHSAGRGKIERERVKERTGLRGERGWTRREVGGIERQGGYEKEETRGRRGQRGPTSPVHALNMYVHPHARVCVRARANINVYHEAHL